MLFGDINLLTLLLICVMRFFEFPKRPLPVLARVFFLVDVLLLQQQVHPTDGSCKRGILANGGSASRAW